MLPTYLLGLLALGLPALAVDTDTNASLNDQLLLAPTWLDRWFILAARTDNPWKYDFASNAQYANRANPGAVCNANKATWPALEGIGATVAQLNLGACSMLPPHAHREHNVVVAVSGTTQTMMIQENGVGVVGQSLGPGQATIFPRASMHVMYNDGCTPNQLYSFLPGGDPSTINVMNNVMLFGQDVGEIVMPWMANCSAVQEAGWNATAGTVPPIGSGSNSWTSECMQRCGMQSEGKVRRRVVNY